MSEEKVIGSIVGVTGHTFDIVYDLFFTTERVIAVIIQHPSDTAQYAPFWQTLFLGNIWTARSGQLERARNTQKKRRSLQNMTPDEMVGAHSRNFGVRYSEISSFEIKRQLLQWQLRIQLGAPSSGGQAVRFNLSQKQAQEAQRLLELVPPPGSKGK